jgi:4-alpha-glucanotransferase
MDLSPEKKIAGVLVPLFALRRDNDLGIGDLAALREFIDWAAEVGFRLVQLLPINEIGGDNSPYNAISAMAIEPTTLHFSAGSPPDLTQDDFDSILAHADLRKIQGPTVNYRRVKKLKRELLERTFAKFSESASNERRSSFQAFCTQESGWLQDYTLFRLLMEQNDESEVWDQWAPEHRSIERARQWLHELPRERQSIIQRRQDFFRYVQWIAFEQWREIKRYAEQRGVALMGDIPFGVSYYSADIFARPNEFALEWSGGAPPEPYFKDDEFTQKWGQNWGIPLYRWDVMRSHNFEWWRQRVRGVKQAFHAFRIDHVLGFYRIYAFPWRPKENKKFLPLDWNQMLERTGGRAPHFAPRDDSTSENCEASRREGEAYLRAVKIPQWEVWHERVIPGSEYERLSVATYATHDHKPIRALWEEAFEQPTATSEQARFDLAKIADFAGLDPTVDNIDFERDFYPAIVRSLFACESWIVIMMLTDLLARRYRFNVPGTAASSNWTRRMRTSVSRLRSSRSVRKRMRLIRTLLEQTERI